MKSRRGQLLIASPRLRDPNFHKAVVLIVKDEEDGTLGVIINRPLDVTVADAVGPEVEAASQLDHPIHQGGPCDGPLSVLHNNTAAGGDEVIGDIRFCMDKEEIEWLMENNTGPMLFFAGYSGWGKGQLDAELEEGAWLLTDATAEHIFDTEGNWSKLTTWMALGKKFDIDRIPDDPSVN